MYQTYELYFEDADGPVRFEALTCRSEAELISVVRSRLADEGAKAVEVRRFGTTLFTLKS